MANANRDEIIRTLLQIGKEYLWPVAKDAFYAYRERILEAHKVSAEERESLLNWIFADDLGDGSQPDKPEPPAEPPQPTVAPYMSLQPPPIPDDAELLARGYKVGDVVVPAVGMPEWLVVRKGQPLLGMVALRVIRDPE